MRTFKQFREESKRTWGTESENLTNEQIQLGAILRIADASEKMASNYDALLSDRNYYKQRYESERDGHKRTLNRNAGLRGYIKRMKGAAK